LIAMFCSCGGGGHGGGGGIITPPPPTSKIYKFTLKVISVTVH
jgi:hypothetical protein